MGTTYEHDCVITFKDSSSNLYKMYPVTKKTNVVGFDEALRNQGIVTSGTNLVYTANVPGITSLTTGVSFVMIPHVESGDSSIKLNVNGLGEKFVRRRLSNTTTSLYQANTPANWLGANKPVTVTYDGTYWIADMPTPYAPDIVGTVAIKNGGTGATTAAQARVNLGIETTNGTVSSGNADYSEVGEWIDGNPDAENRIGYFVCIDNNTPGTTMRKATSSDDIRGVTVASPAFAGGCTADKYYTQTESSDSDVDLGADSRSDLLPKYDYVAIMGIVPVIDDGTCVVNGRCMPNSSGIATSVSGDYGYQVMERIDDTHVLIAVEPGTDFQYKFNASKTAEIKNASHQNILDNGDFIVDTRGRNTVTENQRIIIDNWVFGYDSSSSIGSCTYDASAKTLTLTNTATSNTTFIQQTFSGSRLKSGTKYTIAYKQSGTPLNVSCGLYSYATGSPVAVVHKTRPAPDSRGIISFTFTPSASHLSGNLVLYIYANAGQTVTLSWAAIYEGEYTSGTLPEFKSKGEKVEQLNCGALHSVITGYTLYASAWTGTSPPYTMTKTVEGIFESDTPHIGPLYTTNLTTNIARRTAWLNVSRATTARNSITFYCFENKPTVDIPIQIEVNR